MLAVPSVRVIAMFAVFKQQAHQLIDALPETAGWDQLIYEAAMRRSIEKGLAEAKAGKAIPAEDVIKRLEQMLCE